LASAVQTTNAQNPANNHAKGGDIRFMKAKMLLMVILTAIALSGCASTYDDIPSTNYGAHSGHTGGKSGSGSCH
jgi:hypothetical protein